MIIFQKAAHFGYTVQSVRNLYSSFMNDEMNVLKETSTGPKQPRTQPLIIYKIIALRKDYGLSIDFHQTKFTKALDTTSVSVPLIEF